MKTSVRNLLYDWIPPGFISYAHAVRYVLRQAPYQFVGYSWPQGAHLKGWAAEGVSEIREKEWNGFVASMEGTNPLGISENDLLFPRHININSHNLYMSFGPRTIIQLLGA